MDIQHYFSLLVPLGLTGFDPTPLFVGLYYLTRHSDRAGRRTVLIFGAFILLGTAAWGLLLSLVFGSFMQHVPWHAFFHVILHARIWTTLAKLALGLGILLFGLLRLRCLQENPAGGGAKPAKERSAAGLMIFGAIFILIVTADLAFAAFVAASSSQPLWAQGLGLLGWSALSQFPLVFFLLALLAGKEAIFLRWLEALKRRMGPVFRYALPLLCIAVGGALVLDVLLFPLTRFTLLPFLHV